MDYKTDWTGVPHTAKTAKVVRERHVENSKVIRVDNAYIRGSTVSGYFKLASEAVVKTYAGKRRIEVECLWFGRKPATSWMNITLLSEPEFINGYTGKVALDVRR